MLVGHWLRAYGQLRSNFLQIFQLSRENTLSLEESYLSIWGPVWSLGGAICGCTRDTLCGHLGTCVKITKSRVGKWVRNSDFPCVHSASHCDFTSVSCERRIFKLLLCSYCSWASPCYCVAWKQIFPELLYEHRSPVMQNFHMNWGPRDHMDLTWEDSLDPSSCNWCETAWASCPHLAPRDALSSSLV